jgi:hypothetical protein
MNNSDFFDDSPADVFVGYSEAGQLVTELVNTSLALPAAKNTLEMRARIEALALEVQQGALRRIGGLFPGIGELLRKKLFSFDHSQHSPHELELSLSACRVQMAGVLLVAGDDHGVLTPDPHLIQFETGRIETIVRCHSGLTYARCGERVVILLPDMADETTGGRAGGDLIEVWENCQSSRSWTVDCSAVSQLPLTTMAILLGYRRQLQEKNAELRLVWLRKNALPEQSVQSAMRTFSLAPVGAHLFHRSK